MPPKVEYALTPLGLQLSKVVNGIRLWAYAHMDEIDAARKHYAAER